MFTDPSEAEIPPIIGHYEFGDVIGTGAYAVVRIALDLRTKKKIACKIIPRFKISSEELEDRFEQEIRVLQQMKHRNITQLFDLIKDSKNFYIFMELCPNGELFQTIVERQFLPEKEAKIYLFQIAHALKYVHSMGAVHRDLKPENLLLGDNNEIKITDFGFSRYVGNSGLVGTACGSPCYASPECLSGNPYNGSQSDIWSCGVIFFAMVTGQLPWTKRKQNQLFEQIRKGEFKIPNHLSEGCQQLIKGMMTVDSTKRFSASQIISHWWLADLSTKKTFSTPTLGVSLKKVDEFFEKELIFESFNDIKFNELKSSRISSFNSLEKQLLMKPNEKKSNLPPLITNNSNKNQSKKGRKSLQPQALAISRFTSKLTIKYKP